MKGKKVEFSTHRVQAHSKHKNIHNNGLTLMVGGILPHFSDWYFPQKHV